MNRYILYILLIALVFTGCKSQQLFSGKYEEGKGIPYSALLAYQHEHALAPGDQISVSVWNHSELGIGSVYESVNSNPEFGKWVMVDREGFVTLPMIGRVKLGGNTIGEANEKLTEVYGHFIESPNINMKVLNLEITILGEVNTPGNYKVDKQSTHLAKLIGEAGGLTKYSNAGDIRILRGNYSNPRLIHADLTNVGNMKDAYPVLFPGDIVYIPSRKVKAFDQGSQRMVPFIGVVSAIALIISVTQ